MLISAWEGGGGIGAHPVVSDGALQISVIRIRTSNILQYPVYRCFELVAGPGEVRRAEPHCPRYEARPALGCLSKIK